MDKTTPPSSGAMAAAAETVFESHVLTIDGYTKTTAALGVGVTIRSERFRVGGHSWFIECCPRHRQDDEGAEWVSVRLLPADHNIAALLDDDEVEAYAQYILLDRAGEAIISCGFRQSVTLCRNTTAGDDDGPTTWGISEFIERKALESYLLIKDDDCCRIRCDVTVVREPPPGPDHQHRRNDLGDLLLATDVGKDVTFVVKGERFTAHSCVHAARTSTAFMAEVLAGKKAGA